MKKQDASSSKQPRPTELSEELAELIRRTLSEEMVVFNENVTKLIKESITAENSGIFWSLNEQMDSHAKKFTTVFGKVDSIQANFKKQEIDTAYCIKEISKL